MAKLINSVLLIAFFLIATASVSKCQMQIIGRGLTCSNPSPFPFRPALSGATARLSCDDGGTTVASATTNANGDFNITVNPVPTSLLFFPLTCRVFVTVPANCSIFNLLGRVTVLRSIIIYPVFGQFTVFEARPFIA